MNSAERQKRIESYGGAHAVLVEALKQFPRSMWHYRATPDTWTIQEIVIHITDSEASSFFRARRGIAEPGKMVPGYDEMQWAIALHYHDQSPEDAIELFRWLRGNTHKLIKTLQESTWAQTYVHSESGVTTLDEWLISYDDHVRDHIAQMQVVCDAWQKSGRP